MAFFRNRSVNVKIQKDQTKEGTTETIDIRPIEDKTGAILRKFEKVGLKVFGCVIVYVLVDTYRQVQVARATIDYTDPDE